VSCLWVRGAVLKLDDDDGRRPFPVLLIASFCLPATVMMSRAGRGSARGKSPGRGQTGSKSPSLAAETKGSRSPGKAVSGTRAPEGSGHGGQKAAAKLELTLQGESRLWGFVMVVMGLVLLAGVLVLYLSLAELWTSLTETTCRTTGGTAPKGSACVFPFTYSGTTYYNCTTESNIGKREPWCSTSQYFNGQWGNCNCSTWLDRTIHQIVQGMIQMALILFFPLLPLPPPSFLFEAFLYLQVSDFYTSFTTQLDLQVSDFYTSFKTLGL
jgi:hypothetical protein